MCHCPECYPEPTIDESENLSMAKESKKFVVQFQDGEDKFYYAGFETEDGAKYEGRNATSIKVTRDIDEARVCNSIEHVFNICVVVGMVQGLKGTKFYKHIRAFEVEEVKRPKLKLKEQVR